MRSYLYDLARLVVINVWWDLLDALHYEKLEGKSAAKIRHAIGVDCYCMDCCIRRSTEHSRAVRARFVDRGWHVLNGGRNA